MEVLVKDSITYTCTFTMLAQNPCYMKKLNIGCYCSYMFWTDWGKKPKIEKIGMDGKSRKVIIRSGLKWPNGLALDIETETLYWTDAGTSRIECSTVDGHNRKVQPMLYSY